eukprot:1138300-Pelagomonas_calceolata.AAC.3
MRRVWGCPALRADPGLCELLATSAPLRLGVAAALPPSSCSSDPSSAVRSTGPCCSSSCCCCCRPSCRSSERWKERTAWRGPCGQESLQAATKHQALLTSCCRIKNGISQDKIQSQKSTTAPAYLLGQDDCAAQCTGGQLGAVLATAVAGGLMHLEQRAQHREQGACRGRASTHPEITLDKECCIGALENNGIAILSKDASRSVKHLAYSKIFSDSVLCLPAEKQHFICNEQDEQSLSGKTRRPNKLALPISRYPVLLTDIVPEIFGLTYIPAIGTPI